MTLSKTKCICSFSLLSVLSVFVHSKDGYQCIAHFYSLSTFFQFWQLTSIKCIKNDKWWLIWNYLWEIKWFWTWNIDAVGIQVLLAISNIVSSLISKIKSTPVFTNSNIQTFFDLVNSEALLLFKTSNLNIQKRALGLPVLWTDLNDLHYIRQ